MEIILMRHGQAEEQREGRPDEGRCLTGEGRQRLEKALPGCRRYLDRQTPVLIWSSPLLRAVQTAEILASGLQVKNIRQFDFLASGRFETFAGELAGIADDACLILIGHLPYLSEWSQLICGLDLPFKKGAAAGFRIASLTPLRGDLLWFAQPGILLRQSK